MSGQSTTFHSPQRLDHHINRHRWVLLLCIPLIAIALLCDESVLAQEVEPADADLAEISTYLEAELAMSDAEVSFLIVLKDQFDAEQLAIHSANISTETRASRLQTTYAALTEHAARSQLSLRTWLDERGIHYRTFYVANMIEVVGSTELAEDLRRHPDVKRLISNPQIQQAHLIAPEKSTLPSWLQTVDTTDTRQSSELPYGLRDTNADDLWAKGHTGHGIIVASQDTGVEWNHPALQAQYRGWNAVDESETHTYNWMDAWGVEGRPTRCENDAAVPCDDHGSGHGTHTVGTMLGNETETHTQIGMAPDAQWIGCRNMIQGVGTPASYITCFEFFLAPYPTDGDPATDGKPDQAPHIINNSWACPPSEGCDADSLKQVVETVRAAGIFVVSSAGNEGWSGCSSVQNPIAIYDATFSVGAHDFNGSIAGFSSVGPVTVDSSGRLKPDIAAPGVSTNSATINGGYKMLSGTSMASPHVAGAAALLWSAAPDLIGDIEMTEQALIKGATPVPVSSTCVSDSGPISPDPIFGFGRLNALAAVELALHPANASIQVQAPNDQPIEGASVSLIDETTGFRREATTGSTGATTFEDVLAGRYKIEVTQASRTVAQGFLQVQPDDELEVRLVTAEYRLFFPNMEQIP